MNFTSVAGHIVSMAFEEQYSMKHWNTAPYEHLFKSRGRIEHYLNIPSGQGPEKGRS